MNNETVRRKSEPRKSVPWGDVWAAIALAVIFAILAWIGIWRG